MKYYCGPDWFPSIFRKYLSKKFNLACKFHDKKYEEKNTTRFEADKQFLVLMITKSESTIDLVQAFFYFIFVRLFAKGRWRNC